MRTKLLSLTALTVIFGIAVAATQWTMQPKQSKLTFVANQAGAPFEATFKKFTADIKFDPKDLAGSRFDVKIDLASVDSGDSERDGIITGPDLFAAKQFPSGRYVADKFSDKGGGKFAATGKLTLRNVTRDVPIAFTFQDGKDGAWLKGSANLKRLDFGVGQGEWKDVSSVANEVQVKFTLLLKK